MEAVKRETVEMHYTTCGYNGIEWERVSMHLLQQYQIITVLVAPSLFYSVPLFAIPFVLWCTQIQNIETQHTTQLYNVWFGISN